MLNWWLVLGVALGFGLRVMDGKVISVTAGLALGILLVEGLKMGLWYFK